MSNIPTQARHSPAPWKSDQYGCIRAADGWAIAEVTSGASDSHIKANMHLIAASPDLLVYATASELSRQRDECQRLGIDHSGIDSRLRALGWPKDTDLGFWIRDLCFAAILKAEGGAA